MFDVTINRGHAESLLFTLSRDGSYGQLDTGDSARLVVYIGSYEYLNVAVGTPTADGSTLAIENGLPTPANESAQVLLSLVAGETDEWPVGVLSAELLVTDATDGREYQVEDGRVTVLESAAANGVSEPICGFHELLTFTGSLSTDAERTLLQNLQNVVEGQVRDFLGWDVTQGTQVEYHPSIDRTNLVHPLLLNDTSRRSHLASAAYGLDNITLRQGHVRSITEVLVNEGANDDADFAAVSALNSEEYRLDIDLQQDGTVVSQSGTLYRVAGQWPTRSRTMKVTYVNGYTPTELRAWYPDIVGAIGEEVAGRFAAATKLVDSAGEFPAASFSFGGYSESYDTSVENALAIVRAKLSSNATSQLAGYKHLKLGA